MPELKLPFGPPPKGLHQRLPDWSARLAALVNTNARRPYVHDRFDCIAFAQEAVRTITGVTLLPGVELPSGGWLSCAKFLIRYGLDDLEELAVAALGQPRGRPDESMSGDLVSWEISGEFHLAVRAGDEAVTTSDTGLMVISRTRMSVSGSPASRIISTPQWISAWAVGR